MMMRIPRSIVLFLAILVTTARAQVLVSPVAPPPVDEMVDITLLHLNDVYQDLPIEKGSRGGMARVAKLRRQFLETSPSTLMVFCGDTLSPSVASIIFRGKQMISAWNAVGLDYAALGNHEFDFGPEVLLERMKESKFPWICANVFDRPSGKPFGGAVPCVIRDIKGVKVGFTGLLTLSTLSGSRPGPDVEIRDPVQTAREMVARLKSEGAQVLVGLTHLTYAEDKDVCRAATFDLVLAGHEHVLAQAFVNGTPILRAGSDARYVGRADIHYSRGQGKVDSIDCSVIEVTPAIQEDPEVAATILDYEQRLSRELDLVVGRTLVELDAIQTHNQSRETNLGDFVADALRTYAQTDAALINGGGIRSNQVLGPGSLTKRDVYTILPFENLVVKKTLRGSVLRAALEHGVSKVSTGPDGRFPQISGMSFEYDGSKPVGARVVQVRVGGEPLDDGREYTVAVNSFLARGGDDYTMLVDAPALSPGEKASYEADAVFQALSREPTISTRIDGRIKRVDVEK